MSGGHPYAGRPAALATKHHKQRAIAPALRRALGIQLVVPAAIDTDRLGTFTGEVERPAPPRETALLKARLAIEATGLPRALASEGAFGPHPQAFLVPAGLEILAFVDTDLGLELTEQRLSRHTNFAHTTAATLDGPTRHFLARAGFPTHALVVRPNAGEPGGNMSKGVQSAGELAGAIKRCARLSADRLARLETDMRAHLNPTRMRQIALLARRLAARLAALCPTCAAPGYGAVGGEPGLPCAACRTPTEWIAYEIDGCSRCERRARRPRADGLTAADPANCSYCNP